MLYVIIGAFIILGSIIWCIIHKEDVTNLAVVIMFTSIAMIAISFVSSSIITEIAEQEYVCYETIEITALKDGSGTEGHSYVFTGHVEEKQYYYYMTKTEHGYKTNNIAADNTYIVEDNNGQPRIEKCDNKFKNKNWYWLGMPMENGINRIYVPEGSVVNEFVVDLEG